MVTPLITPKAAQVTVTRTLTCSNCGVRKGKLEQEFAPFDSDKGKLTICASCQKMLSERGFLRPEDETAQFIREGKLVSVKVTETFIHDLLELPKNRRATRFAAQIAFNEAAAKARLARDDDYATARHAYDKAIAPARRDRNNALTKARQKYSEAVAQADQVYNENK